MNQQHLPHQPYRGTLRERLAVWRKEISTALYVALIFGVVAGPGRLIKWHFMRKQAKGESVWLDAWTFGAKATPAHNPLPEQAADISPNREVKTRKSRIIKHDGYPEPEYPFAYQNPPLSGNIINGLNEIERRRAGKVFHTVDYGAPWGGLEFYFHLADSLHTFGQSMQSTWENRHKDGPVNPVQQLVNDPAAMAEAIKAAAQDMGAVAVGITTLKEHHLFEGADVAYKYAISIALPMDREAMLTVPSEESLDAVMTTYLDVGRVALELAARIRAAGWGAQAHATLSAADVLHIPIAVDAGLGQLGKHGSLITQSHGSNVRLSTVVTNLPLATDDPVDIGVDDFCTSCQICVTNCPPHAIFDTKQTVRGVERWYVNFDTCAPYFSQHGGCGICIEVCPWSEAGRGPLMTEKMLAKREPRLIDIAAEGQQA